MSRSSRSKKRSDPQRKPAAPGDVGREKVGLDLWIAASFQMAFLAVIVFALTPKTLHLDDIKLSLFLILGPVMALIALSSMAWGSAPFPPRIVGGGLAAYLAVLLLSTLTSEFSWAGWIRLPFILAAVGFFLGGMTAGSTRRTSVAYLVFLVVLLFIVNLLGFFQYDLFGGGRTGVAWLYRSLYGAGSVAGPGSPALQLVLQTFDLMTRSTLMSTMLNRDFLAAFCLLHFPMAIALALIARRWYLQAIGIATILFSLVSIFLCKSKGEYFFAIVVSVFFIALYALVVRKVRVKNSYLAAWGGGMLILLATLLFLNAPTLASQLKSVPFSVSSRSIIWAGALGIFGAFPLLGSGPGTFKIYFPRHRSADYFEHGISNVTLDAHNYILDILSETGLLGGLTYATFALGLAYLAFRALFQTRDTGLRLMLIAALCGLLGMYGSNMTSPNAQRTIGAVALWSMLGFLTGLVMQARGIAAAEASPGASAKKTRRAAESRIARGELGVRARASLALAGLVFIAAVGLGWREGIRYWRGAKSYGAGKQLFTSHMSFAAKLIQGQEQDPLIRQRTIAALELCGVNFRDTIESYPENLSAYYQLGSVENYLAMLKPEPDLRHLRASQKAYEDLHEFAPDYAELHYNLGIIYYRLARSEESDSQELLEKSLSFFESMGAMSQRREVLINLGDTYHDAGDHDRAQEQFAKGMRLYPDDLAFAQRFYQCSSELNDRRSQIESLKALWLLQPGTNDRLYEALDIALAEDFSVEFEDLLETALARNPVDPAFYDRQARYGENHDDHDLVLTAVTAYVKLGGRDKEVLTRGVTAAQALDDSGPVRAFYSVLRQQNEAAEFRLRAEAWLATHP